MSRIIPLAATAFVLSSSLSAELGKSAYRVLGQSDLRRNSVNSVEGAELFGPQSVALDTRDGTVRVYVADSRNHRILGWRDAASYHAGARADLCLGQPTFRHTAPLGIGPAGLNQPAGMAVDPATGNLYVADTGNHRVLRFPDPFTNPGRVEPDAVFGQVDFNSRVANPSGISRSSLSSPLEVAFDLGGNLWVSDSGNHRVLRFSRGQFENSIHEADLVIGQANFVTGLANRGNATISALGFDKPWGIAFDTQGNLFVSDSNNSRVLVFSPPFQSDSGASNVLGQADFGSRMATEGATSLRGPAGLAIGPAGLLYVSVPAENRVMIFSASSGRNSPATNVLGQSGFSSTGPNAESAPRASASTLSAPYDVQCDPAGNVFVADYGNNRVLLFGAGSRSASKVWGQLDFSANGVNQVKPNGVNSPSKIVVDYASAPFAIYVSDTDNNRILGWRDATRMRNGDPADFVIGQPDLRTGLANENSAAGRTASATTLSAPRGMAIDRSGNLYVADSGNNRILRYPRPVDQILPVRPDMVVGQPDFNSSLSALVSASSLRQPAAIAIASDGTMFVADTGNNRVLEFAPNSGFGAAAIRVYGQPDFSTATSHLSVSPQTLGAPGGVAVDGSFNLYVADTGANRVLVFPNVRDAPAAGTPALMVIGNDRFDSVATGLASSRRFSGPKDIALGSMGEIYVSDTGNHRVLVFPSLFRIPVVDAEATSVIGQRDYIGNTRNWNASDGLPTAEGMSAPAGVYLDRMGTLYVADSGNHRVTHYLGTVRATHAANAQASTLPRGGVISLDGSGFSFEEGNSGPPLAQSLAGREVVINDEVRTPLVSVSPSLIRLQVPSSSPVGTQRIAVRVAETGELIAGGGISIGAYSPGLFSEVLNQDGGVNSSSNPAAKGSVVRLSGSGQGPVSPVVADGEAAPDPPVNTIAVPTADGGACLSTQPSVCVAMGDLFGEVQFSGLEPGKVGTWQLRVRIPATAPTGATSVRAVINGQPSNLITVYVR